MSLETLAGQSRANADLATAASNTPNPGSPNGSSGAGVPLPPGTPLGLDRAQSGMTVVGAQARAASSTSTLAATSVFPDGGIDSFPTHTNDAGEVVTANHFNILSAATGSIEDYTAHLMRTAPGDLLSRLNTSHQRQIAVNGVVEIYENLFATPTGTPVALPGGSQPTSLNIASVVRRPVLVTVGGTLSLTGTTPITGFSPPPSLSLTLTSDQKTVLGLTARVQDLRGLSFFGGAKLQKPNVDPELYDACAAAARVEIRLDDNGAATTYLCPGHYCATGDADAVRYSASAGHAPYLLPGVWYIWITFMTSAYTW